MHALTMALTPPLKPYYHLYLRQVTHLGPVPAIDKRLGGVGGVRPARSGHTPILTRRARSPPRHPWPPPPATRTRKLRTPRTPAHCTRTRHRGSWRPATPPRGAGRMKVLSDGAIGHMVCPNPRAPLALDGRGLLGQKNAACPASGSDL